MQNFKVYIALIVIVIFAGCNDAIKYPDGGYDYPQHVADKDTNFYCYPLKNILSRKDSLYYSDYYISFQVFNEPNLSLKPLKQDEFRLYYEAALGYPVIITLKENELIIKKGKGKLYFDETKLSKLEKVQYLALERYYPIDRKDKEIPKYIDSLISLYPEMLTPAYYNNLMHKMAASNVSSFTYTIKKIPITKKDFVQIVSIINNSGYWKLPFNIHCGEAVSDGYTYSLEANTNKKYNIVTTSCGIEEKFAKACQQIVNYAQMGKEISIWSDATDTTKNYIIENAPLEEIKPVHVKHKRNIIYLSNKKSTVQGSDTTKMP